MSGRGPRSDLLTQVVSRFPSLWSTIRRDRRGRLPRAGPTWPAPTSERMVLHAVGPASGAARTPACAPAAVTFVRIAYRNLPCVGLRRDKLAHAKALGARLARDADPPASLPRRQPLRGSL